MYRRRLEKSDDSIFVLKNVFSLKRQRRYEEEEDEEEEEEEEEEGNLNVK